MQLLMRVLDTCFWHTNPHIVICEICWWISTTFLYFQCLRSGDTTVLRYAINWCGELLYPPSFEPSALSRRRGASQGSDPSRTLDTLALVGVCSNNIEFSVCRLSLCSGCCRIIWFTILTRTKDWYGQISHTNKWAAACCIKACSSSVFVKQKLQ